MNFECRIQEVKPAITIAYRFTSSIETITRDLTLHFPRVVDFLKEVGEHPAGFSYMCIYSMEFGNWQVECGFPVLHPIPGNGEFIASTIPGGRCATTMHRGPYPELIHSYERLANWMKANQLIAKGPLYEYSMNDPRITKPEDLYAGLMIPI